MAGRLRSDAVAAAFSAVARESFIPEVLAEHGPQAVYRDEVHVTKKNARGLPLSSSSQPSIMAEMLELLDLRPGQRVLEIGAGTGYNAALLAHIVGPGGRVTTVDVDAAIASGARRSLRAAGYRVTVVTGDGRAGWPQRAPYDRILVTASAATVPSAWLAQLAEGGRVELPLRLTPATAETQLIPVLERRGDCLRSVAVTWGGFMPLHGGDGGWNQPLPGLSANRSTSKGRSSLASISGAGLERLSDSAARAILAAALSGSQSPRRQGWTERRAGRPLPLIVYLLLRIPDRRRVWVTGNDRLGIGTAGRRGQGLAVLSVRGPRSQPGPPRPGRRGNSQTKSAPGRARWRIDSYGPAGKALEELDEILADWHALQVAHRTELEITGHPAGDTLRLRFGWTAARPDRRSS